MLLVAILVRTSKGTEYCPNCTLKCVINYTNNVHVGPSTGTSKSVITEQSIRDPKDTVPDQGKSKLGIGYDINIMYNVTM